MLLTKGLEGAYIVKDFVKSRKHEWYDACFIRNIADKRVMETAAEEGLLAERQPNSGTVKQLEAFMDKHGYRDGRGWWVKK